jgi:hypothetical protein
MQNDRRPTRQWGRVGHDRDIVGLAAERYGSGRRPGSSATTSG